MDVVQLSVVGHANRALAVSPAFTWILKCIDPTLFGELREMQQLLKALPVGTLKIAKRKKECARFWKLWGSLQRRLHHSLRVCHRE